MAKLTMQKARKEYICSKCKNKILIGENYKKIVAMYSLPKIVCSNCKISRSELTSSEYFSWLYDLKDNLKLKSLTDIQNLVDSIQNQRDILEEKYDNIPDHLKENDAANLLQERMDELDDVIFELEKLDYEETDISEKEIQKKLNQTRDIVCNIQE